MRYHIALPVGAAVVALAGMTPAVASTGTPKVPACRAVTGTVTGPASIRQFRITATAPRTGTYDVTWSYDIEATPGYTMPANEGGYGTHLGTVRGDHRWTVSAPVITPGIVVTKPAIVKGAEMNWEAFCGTHTVPVTIKVTAVR